MKATIRACPLVLLIAAQLAYAQQGDPDELAGLDQDLEDMQHIIDDIYDVEALLEHEIADRMAGEADHLGIVDSNDGDHVDTEDDHLDTEGEPSHSEDIGDGEENEQQPEAEEAEVDVLNKKQAMFERKVEEIEAVEEEEVIDDG